MKKNISFLPDLISKLNPQPKTNSYYFGKDFYRFAGVEYDYDTYNPCHNGSDCCDNDYCRCGVIQNARVSSVDLDILINDLISHVPKKDLEKEEITTYCLDRIVRNSNLKDTGSWEVQVDGGYYGQEVRGASLDGNALNGFIKSLSNMVEMSDCDKVKNCLIDEYGFLLPELNSLTSANIQTVELKNVILPNRDYSRKIDKKYIDQYNDYKLPRAICIKENSKFRLIDGYHRILSAINQKFENVQIIVLS